MNKIIKDYAHDYRNMNLSEQDMYLTLNGCVIEYLKEELKKYDYVTDSDTLNASNTIICNFIGEKILELINKIHG